MERKVNILDKIGSLIPGYSGYSERASRRGCDKNIRLIISNKISYYESLIIEKINSKVENSEKESISKLETCRKKINTFKSKIDYAPYGLSSFFNDQQIRENELEEIYLYDLDLFESVEKIQTLLDNDNINELTELIQKIYINLNKRNEYILKFK